MQFRLSTLFLIVFVVATSLAVYGGWGIGVAAILLLAALRLHRCEELSQGIYGAVFIIFIGIICLGLFQPVRCTAPKAARKAQCSNNLAKIGLALHKYHAKYGHFPELCERDTHGKPLLSWRVQILPTMEYGPLHDELRQDEPWDGSHNRETCKHIFINEYHCPCDYFGTRDCSTSYIAVIGPGTAWREEGSVKISDLPDGGSHTIMAVETMNSGIHWAEPRDLTVKEALERMKSEQMAPISDKTYRRMQNEPAPRISSPHYGRINVLYADGAVRSFPTIMPISQWEKMFAGDIKDLDAVEDSSYESASDLADVGVPCHIPPQPQDLFVYRLMVWLISVVLLFRCAVKSRGKDVGAVFDPQVGDVN
jgi:prepilin-type processing-associated H-X9-DG protein